MHLDNFVRDARNYLKECSFNPYILISIVFAILISFVGYAIVFQSPSGTDAYSHMVNTIKMSESTSLNSFYESQVVSGPTLSEYPFGLWYYGSIIMKVTGMDIYTLSILFPLLNVFISLVVFFAFARCFLGDTDKTLFSLLFLISMPQITISFLNYSPSSFIIPILTFIFLLAIKETSIKNILILYSLIFILCITHTGTYLFLLLFVVLLFFIFALFWNRFEVNYYLTILGMLGIYVVSAILFPSMKAQYVYKGTLILSFNRIFFDHFGLKVLYELNRTIYDNIFVSNDIVYVIFWACVFFVVGKFLQYLHTTIVSSLKRYSITIPFIGTIENISHSIEAAPFWIGPLQSFLSIIGFFKLDSRGKGIFLSLIAITVVPGLFQSGEGTGVLKEIFYLYLFVPITSVLGLFVIIEFFERKFSRRKFFMFLLYTVVFATSIVTPVIGNLYYQPTITGTINERENLVWLSTVGDATQGVASYAYRDRIDLYANKPSPRFSAGRMYSSYESSLHNIFFRNNSESDVLKLYGFNIQYFISSERIWKNFNKNFEDLKIDSNQQLDRIYSSDQRFGIYNARLMRKVSNLSESEKDRIQYVERTPSIQDLGSIFLIQTDYYTIKMAQTSPRITYLGTRKKNLLGQGGIFDYVSLEWSRPYSINVSGFYLHGIEFSEVSYSGNELLYKTVVKRNKTEEWASLSVRYTFYEKSFKRDIIVSHDQLESKRDLSLKTSVETLVFAPFSRFNYTDIGVAKEGKISKAIYPLEDYVQLKDLKIRDIFFDRGDSGIFLQYLPTNPYPGEIIYSGSTVYNYGEVYLESSSKLSYSEPLEVTTYFSIGKEPAARAFVQQYISVSPSPYPDGIIPVVFLVLPGSTTSTTDVESILKEHRIPYQTVLSSQSNISLARRLNPLGSVRVYGSDGYLPIETQKRNIQQMIGSVKTRGVYFADFMFNLDSIRVSSDNGIGYVLALPINPPFFKYNREGVRNPKMSYLEMNETGIYLVPVVASMVSDFESTYQMNNIHSEWLTTMETVRDFGGMAVLMIRASDIASDDVKRQFTEMVTYPVQYGMTYTTLDEIYRSLHYQENISSNISKQVDSATIWIYNKNLEAVKKLAYSVSLPVINSTCPYTATNGERIRYEIDKGMCRMIFATSVAANDTQILIIEPTEPRNTFSIDFSGVYEGANTVTIRDMAGMPVPGVTLYVDYERYESNKNGEIKFSVSRGVHTFTLEKPGFRTYVERRTVKPLLFFLFG
ncbi:MAG: hypothetical protein QHG99_09005 [Methanomicrobiales archaeon]|nr:hypothetical protein [Methanomicrobiales archaeon]